MVDPGNNRAASKRIRSAERTARWVGALIRACGWLSTSLAVGLAERVFSRTGNPLYLDGEREFLATADRVDLTVGRQRLATFRWGESNRPTIVVLHGWRGHTGRMSMMIQSLISAGWSVVGIDAPGHGASGGSRTTMPEIALSLERLVPTLANVHGVIGYSLGGTAALFATSRGTTFSRIVTISAPSEVVQWVEQFRKAVSLNETVFALMRKRMQRRIGVEWHELDMIRAVSKISVAGMIVHDETDQTVPVEQARLLAKNWPSSSLYITNGLGHRGTITDAGVIEKVVKFMS